MLCMGLFRSNALAIGLLFLGPPRRATRRVHARSDGGVPERHHCPHGGDPLRGVASARRDPRGARRHGPLPAHEPSGRDHCGHRRVSGRRPWATMWCTFAYRTPERGFQTRSRPTSSIHSLKPTRLARERVKQMAWGWALPLAASRPRPWRELSVLKARKARDPLLP